MNILNLLKLYRLDVFVITAVNGICGYYFTYGQDEIMTAILPVLFISGVLYNYVYTINAITDITSDRINKPERPLPSGKLPYKAAMVYLIFLIIISITGIILLFKGTGMIMAFLVLIIGGIYSLPPFELKNIPILASFITGWGLVHPIFIMGSIEVVWLPAIILTCYSTGTALLKDLSDLQGDKAEGRNVTANFINMKNLMIVSMFMTLLAAILCLELEYKIIGLAPLATFFTTLYFFVFKEDEEIEKKVYKKMALSVAVSGAFVMIMIVTGIA